VHFSERDSTIDDDMKFGTMNNVYTGASELFVMQQTDEEIQQQHARAAVAGKIDQFETL
jgi:hypothetical protein